MVFAHISVLVCGVEYADVVGALVMCTVSGLNWRVGVMSECDTVVVDLTGFFSGEAVVKTSRSIILSSSVIGSTT